MNKTETINHFPNKFKKNNYSPIAMLTNLWKNKDLIKQLIKRDIAIRYRGSGLGILWSLITPLFMLVVYTFVFGVVFNSRWGAGTSKIEYALILFSGIMTFNILAEVLNRAPSLILSNVNYVKKVIFPLEILPVVIIGSALVHLLISLSIAIMGIAILLGSFHWTIIFLPLVLLPLILISLGVGWFFTSLGVYFRDIGHIIGLFVQALMFLSPIFYPVSAIPPKLQVVFWFNPLSYVVEDVRRILLWGQLPNLGWIISGTILGFMLALLGYIWFQKTKGGFADVL